MWENTEIALVITWSNGGMTEEQQRNGDMSKT
jgi:hypothetical protein